MCDDKNCSLKRAIAGGPSLVPVSGSNIHNIKKRNNHKYADTCLVAIAVHLCKMQNVLHWHGSQIAHVAIFSWRKHP